MLKNRTLKKIVNIIIATIILLLSISACANNQVNNTDAQVMFMKKNKDFKILTISDTHLNAESSYLFLRDTMERLLDAHKPDLVVFGGDNVDRKSDLIHLENIALFLEERQQYWAIVLGNHDRDPEDSQGVPTGLHAQNALLQEYNRFNRENAYCLYVESEAGYTEQLDYTNYPREGNDWSRAKFGNYGVQIKDNDKTVYALVFMDTGHHRAPFNETNGYIEEYQVDWYKQYMYDLSSAQTGKSELELDDYIPSMIFTHQPILEYIDSVRYALNGSEKGMIPEQYGFGYSDNMSGGTVNERVNHGLFDAMKMVGGTHIFAGHTHGNNFSINYEGVWFNQYHRVGRRDREAAMWPDHIASISKLITIKAKTHKVEMTFALPNGYTTQDIEEAYAVNQAYYED